MEAIVAIMLVAICDADLLHCKPLETWQAIWKDVSLCQVDRPLVEDRVRSNVGTDQIVMTRCRLFVDEGFAFQLSIERKKQSEPDRYAIPTS